MCGRADMANHETVRMELRHWILSRAAHVWYRLQVPMSSFPWRLCALTDARLSYQEKLTVARELYQMPLCCLDPGFSRKVPHLIEQ